MTKSRTDSKWKKLYYRWKNAVDPHEEARLAREQLAYLYEKEGQFDEALAELDMLIYGQRGGPCDYRWLINRAGLNIKIGRLKQALEDSNEAIDYIKKDGLGNDRGLAHALLACGVVRALLGDPLLATNDYNEALELQPDLHGALASREDRYETKRRLDEVLAKFTENNVFFGMPIGLRTIEGIEKTSFR